MADHSEESQSLESSKERSLSLDPESGTTEDGQITTKNEHPDMVEAPSSPVSTPPETSDTAVREPSENPSLTDEEIQQTTVSFPESLPLQEEEDKEGKGRYRNLDILPSPVSSGEALDPSLANQEGMEMHHVFGGLTYLGSSVVDAPMSASEANNKMATFKEHHGQAIMVKLAIPQTNAGTILMVDPGTDQPLASFTIRTVLLCVRGQELEIADCICFNVKNRKSSFFLCHVFLAATEELCEKVFVAIGNAFRTKPSDLEILRDGFQLSYEIDVTLEIQEDLEGRGSFTCAVFEKDCFKLRQNAQKQLILSLAQPNVSNPLVVDKCFGMLVAPGKGAAPLSMILLDMISMGYSQDRVYTVVASLNPTDPVCEGINEETPKGSKAYLTVAADLVLRGIAEPVRFVREVEVRVQKGESQYLASIFSRRKKNTTERFILQIEKAATSTKESPCYRIGTMISAKEGKEHRQPYAHAVEQPIEERKDKQEDAVAEADSDIDDDELLVSGWGDVNKDFSDDLVGQWGSLLERWDGQDKSRPKTLRKLCSKGIPSLLRCQIWQMLTTAIYDPQLVDAYRLLITMESPTKDIIDWDIKRTYVAHEFFREEQGKEALEKISKAYSVYDEEVGYCQGLSFIAAVLLLQKMPEETAFAVLVKIMFDYKHRELFKSGFHTLHLCLFQLDKLIEEYMPDLQEHLATNRVEAHMFATQWFFTLYTAKFPLPLVFQFMDMYLCDRTPAMFQAALALLKTARKDLLSMDFENILKYFRVTLPRKFLSQEDCNNFFRRMMSFKVDEKKLKKLEKDYQVHLEAQVLAQDPLQRLKHENSHLRDVVGRLEHENEYLAQELVGSKVHLREEMNRLEEKIDTLSKDGRRHQSNLELANKTISDLRKELEESKQMCEDEQEKLVEERKHHEVAINEYRSALRQMDEDSITQQNLLKKKLVELQSKVDAGIVDGEVHTRSSDRSDGSDITSKCSFLEQRVKDLELELAQTKLALVEASCHSQELEHKLNSHPQTPTGKRRQTGPSGT